MRSKDLTEGNISKQLLLFFLPIAAGTLFQQFYSAADALIVGKFVGTVALAAVGGSAGHITNILVGFFVALSGGASVVVGHFFGAKDDEHLRQATGTAVEFCLIAGICLTVVGLIFAKPMLVLLKTPEDTIAGAALYVRIIFLGVIPQLLYNMEAGLLRAVGDSRRPFIYLFIACITNIILDIVFVVVFSLGVAGVAMATVLSQLLSAVLATVQLARSKEAYRFDVRAIRIDPFILKRMMTIGIPAGLQNSMYAVSNMIVQVAVNSLGTAVVAAWSLTGKLDGVYWAVNNAVGMSVMSFAAQNYGAGKFDRVKKCERLSLSVFMVLTFILSGAILLVARIILPFFTDDPAVRSATWTMLLIFVPTYFTWTFIEILSGILRGIGDAIKPVIICGLGICLLRVIWILTVFMIWPGIFTVSVVYPVSWVVTDIAFIVYYRKGSKMSKIKA